MAQSPAKKSRLLLLTVVALLLVVALTVFSFVMRPVIVEPFEPLWTQAVYLGSGICMLCAAFLAQKRIRSGTGAAGAYGLSLALAVVPAIGGFFLFGMRADGMAMLPIGACSFLVTIGVLLPALSSID